MAEKILLKVRVDGVDTADVITSAAGIATADWVEQPLTLRDDEVSITEGDVTESETFSHENDSPEDYDITGSGMTAIGSFIKATYAQMAGLLGGTVSGADDAAMFLKSSKKVLLNKALRFRLKSGGYIIIPNAKGYVNMSANLTATDGMLKFPFSFRAMAQAGFDCDLILKSTPDAAGAQSLAAPMTTAATVEAVDTGETTEAKTKASK